MKCLQQRFVHWLRKADYSEFLPARAKPCPVQDYNFWGSEFLLFARGYFIEIRSPMKPFRLIYSENGRTKS